MANRAVVIAVAVVVGVGVYIGLVALEDQVTTGTDVPAPGDVVVVNTTMHLDRVGRPTVVGEVVNGRSGPVADATLTVEYYRDGGHIGTARGHAPFAIIAPGEAAPFAVRLDDQTARPDDYAVTVTVDPADSAPYGGLSVAQATLADRSQTRLIVVGSVRNNGGQVAQAHIVATFYDANGDVVGARVVRPSPGVLSPGDDAAFTVRFQTLGNVPSRAAQVERFEVTAYGEPTA